jgi:hypothetical protein
VTFDAGAFSRRTRYFEWDFGDGFSDSVEVPVHTYRVPGLYDVRVRMWTATGCRDTVERVYPGAIRVNPRPKVAMAIAPQRVTIYQPLIQVRADSVDADPKTQERIRFFTRQWVDAVSPSNFLPTNPEVQQRLIETQGESLVKGMQNMLADLGRGTLSITDDQAFEVGRNVGSGA